MNFDALVKPCPSCPLMKYRLMIPMHKATRTAASNSACFAFTSGETLEPHGIPERCLKHAPHGLARITRRSLIMNKGPFPAVIHLAKEALIHSPDTHAKRFNVCHLEVDDAGNTSPASFTRIFTSTKS